MRGRQMNLRHLRAFVEVCQHGGISAAAGAIHLSQPAITQAIAKMEELLHTALFVRSGRGMTPTEPGAGFLRRATRALNILKAGAPRQRAGGFADVITSTELRALIAVAEHGNFSVAARAIGVAQPSLYRRARDLEDIAQQPLYVKTQQGYDLTPAARRLVRSAKLAFAELDQGIQELHAADGIDAATISIGSLPLARSALLPIAINRLTAVQPDVQIKVVDSPFNDLLHALRDGDIDMIIGALRDPLPAPDVLQTPLLNDHLGVFCGPGHPLIGAGRLAGRIWLATLGSCHARAPPRASISSGFSATASDARRAVSRQARWC